MTNADIYLRDILSTTKLDTRAQLATEKKLKGELSSERPGAPFTNQPVLSFVQRCWFANDSLLGLPPNGCCIIHQHNSICNVLTFLFSAEKHT